LRLSARDERLGSGVAAGAGSLACSEPLAALFKLGSLLLDLGKDARRLAARGQAALTPVKRTAAAPAACPKGAFLVGGRKERRLVA
jgi:hypothetical protein